MRNFAVVVVLLFASVAHGSLVIDPDAVKRATVFIFPADASGNPNTLQPLGTGFLVQIPTVGSARVHVILMTARHIFDPQWLGCNGPNPDVVFMRLNKKVYDPAKDLSGVEYVKIPLRSDGAPLYRTPEDDEVDAAVALFDYKVFSVNDYDAVPISIKYFATDEELAKLSTGDEIVSAGLVPGAQGELRNYPVFKFGFISDERPEPFRTGCGGNSATRLEKVWLISMNMFPGASGSAIFYTPPGNAGLQFGLRLCDPL